MANNTNSTGCVHQEVFYQVIQSVVFCILSILVIGGNTFCLMVLKQARYLKTPTRLFLASLTCADLFTGLFVIFPSFVVFTFFRILPETTSSLICGVKELVGITWAMLSVVSLLLINFDRYLAIEFPLTCDALVTSKRARIAIGSLWTTAPLAAVGGYFVVRNNFKVDGCTDNLCQRLFRFDTRGVIYLSFCTFIFAILPLLITAMIYVRIFVIVRRHKAMEKKLYVTRANLTTGTYRRSSIDWKALNTFLLVTVVSSFTWFPYSFFSLYTYFVGQTSNDDLIDVLVMTFSFNNCWVNILVYTLRDRSFRNAAKKLLPKCCRKQPGFNIGHIGK